MPGTTTGTARTTAARPRAITLSLLCALALTAGACGAATPATPGGTGPGTSGHGASYQPARAVTASPSPSPRSSSPPVQLVVEASGDLLIHSPVWERALALGGGRHYNFAPLFARVRPYITSAGLPLCHLETPLTPGPPSSYPVFNTPPELAKAIHQTGWRACSTASNHTLDQGQRGVGDTLRALNRAGVRHTGSYGSAAQRARPLIMTVQGVRVALLAYTEFTNGIPLPHPWSVNLASAARIIADARRARADGAQIVIVNLHWGDEYVAWPSHYQWQLARRLTRSPAIDAIVGQHAHVVQPIRFVNGKPVVFGEGNLISNQTAACCPAATQDGMIVLLTFVVRGRSVQVTKVRYVPVWVRHPDFEVLPAGTAWRNDRAHAAELRASYRRTVAVVGRGPRIQPVPARL
ncbi:MAG TPA: CapA family protein [Streptosporangiaceae bacterium]